MNTVKKISRLLLVLAMLLSMVGCTGNATGTSSAPETEAQTSETKAAINSTEATVSTEEGDPTSADTPQESSGNEITLLGERPSVSLPLTTQSEALTMWCGGLSMDATIDSYSECDVAKELENRTGVAIEFIENPPPTISEQFNLMIASGDYADIICEAGSYKSPSDLIDEDICIDINDYIDSAPSYAYLMDQDQSLYKVSHTDDGAFYAFRDYIINNFGPIAGGLVRGDWLDKAGLDVPETYDDYYNMLKAFKDSDLCGYPLELEYVGVPSGNNLVAGYGIRAYTNSSGNFTDYYIKDDGTVAYGPIQPEFKGYLEMLAKWYSEGLISPNFLSNSMISTSDITTSQVALFWQNAENIEQYEKAAEDADYYLVAVPDAVMNSGDTLSMGGNNVKLASTGGISISTACKTPEIAVSLIDYLYSAEGSLLVNYGVDGRGLAYDKDGYPVFSELVTDNPDGLAYSQSRLIYTWTLSGGITDYAKLYNVYSESQINASKTWASNRKESDNDYFEFFTLTTEENESYSAVYNDINTYITENIAAFITGDKSLDEFDKYVEDVEGLGIKSCVEIVQAAKERFLSR